MPPLIIEREKGLLGADRGEYGHCCIDAPQPPLSQEGELSISRIFRVLLG
jgi:hypothetical protein